MSLLLSIPASKLFLCLSVLWKRKERKGGKGGKEGIAKEVGTKGGKEGGNRRRKCVMTNRGGKEERKKKKRRRVGRERDGGIEGKEEKEGRGGNL